MELLVGIASIVNALVLVGAVFYARRQVIAAREASEAQLRPFVVVDIDTYKDPPLMSLTIENVGHTVANNVSMTFTPTLRSSFDDEKTGNFRRDLELLSKPIETLAPGKRYELLFDHGPDRAKADLDDRYDVTVSYEGNPMGSKSAREYTSRFVLDIGAFWGMEYTINRGTKDIYNQLKRVADEMRKWTSDGSGVLVKSPEDRRREHEAWVRNRDAVRAERQAKAQESQSASGAGPDPSD